MCVFTRHVFPETIKSFGETYFSQSAIDVTTSIEYDLNFGQTNASIADI